MQATSTAVIAAAAPSQCLTLDIDDKTKESLLFALTLAEVGAATAICTVSPQGKPCPHGSPPKANACSGTIALLKLDDERCEISYRISGLTPGLHGFHIHEKADFSNGCLSAGPHYNPHGKKHGAPQDEERHVGDLGNIVAGADGVASGVIVDRLIKLDGPYSVVGRSFMVHKPIASPSARVLISLFSFLFFTFSLRSAHHCTLHPALTASRALCECCRYTRILMT